MHITPLVVAAMLCGALSAAAQVPEPAPLPAPPFPTSGVPAPQPPGPPAPTAPPVPEAAVPAPFPYVDLDFVRWELSFGDWALRDPDTFYIGDFALQRPVAVSVRPEPGSAVVAIEGAPDGLYQQALALIDRGQFDRAVSTLDRIIETKQPRADAAMYWKAYSFSRMARAADALAAVAELQKRFPSSPWVRDARALDVQVRQASGQAVSADAQVDDDTKLLALQGVMRTNPDLALPVIEQLLAGDSSVRVKERALFVVSRSRSPRARDLIANVARGASNPDLRMAGIRYLGMVAGPEARQTLQDIYRGSNDVEVKRTILRSFMTARAQDALLAVARTESSPELRGEAVQQLGVLRAGTELEELYRTEANIEVKKRILQAMFVANASDKLAPIARTEKDPELRRAAIRNLGISNRADAVVTLTSIYNADASVETRQAVIEALGMHRNGAAALVTLARTEKNPELRTTIVRRLTNMRAPEASAYLLELLR